MSPSTSGSLVTPTVLLVPGIGNSGPEHWQTCWEANYSNCRRVQQRNWDEPVCHDWLECLDGAIERAGPETLIAAHSLGCLLVAHWALRSPLRIKGALLVAVPDPNGPSFPGRASGFAPVPKGCLPMRSVVVASTDDPYADSDFARACAEDWGSRFACIGAAGHINAESGLGDWAEGHRLLEQLVG